jgi:hypothetical protein
MPTHCEFDLTQRSINFPRQFVGRPRLAHGLREIDIINDENIRISSTYQNITRSSVDCNIITWAETTLLSAAADVLAIAPGELDILTGEHMRCLWKNPTAPPYVRIDFERPFETPPKVAVFLNCVDLEKSRNWHVQASAMDVDVHGFVLFVGTDPDLDDTGFYAARVGWIAYPEDRANIFSTSISTLDVRPVEQPALPSRKEISFDSSENRVKPAFSKFLKAPSVFIALNSFNIDCHSNLRINAYVDNVTTNGLVWHIDSWDDSTVYSAGATIIAFNQ